MADADQRGFFRSLRFRYGLALISFLAIAGYFLWEEHEAHIIGYLPLVLLLAVCGGMHFFMHGGHGHGNRDGSGDSNQPRKFGGEP